MKHFHHLKVAIILCLAILLYSEDISSAEKVRSQEEQLDHDWAKLEKDGDNLSVRAVMEFMLEAVPLHWHSENIDKAMVELEELQDKDPHSKSYGNFRWYRWQSNPVDLNAVEFVMQRGTLLWNLYRKELSPASQDRLSKIINLSVEGIQHHNVDVDYTNIYLMKIWNLIAIGEAFQRKEIAEQGYAMFQQWKAAVDQHGIHEYLSPTYTGTQLDSLVLLNSFATREEDQDLAERAIKLIYEQCRANFFPPGERLGGPHSRDYDYLLGHGYFDQYLSEWGWMPSFSPPVLHTYVDLTTWKHLDSADHSPEPTPRFIWQKFGAAPKQYATQYVGQNMSIGTAGCGSGPEDKAFAINFAGGPKMVMALFFMDGRGDPYGHIKVKGKDGHPKAHHLSPFIVSSQDGPDVLFLSSQDLLKSGEPLACLNSHLDFPVEATVWQGDQELPSTSAVQVPLDTNQPLFLRYQNTAVGFRFQATDDSGNPINPTYSRDGNELQAARVSWVQAQGAPAGEAHVIFWARAAENLDDKGFSEFRADFAKVPVSFQFEKGKVVGSLQTGSATPLEIHADLVAKTGKSSVPDYPGILYVNGQEIGQRILDR